MREMRALGVQHVLSTISTTYAARKIPIEGISAAIKILMLVVARTSTLPSSDAAPYITRTVR